MFPQLRRLKYQLKGLLKIGVSLGLLVIVSRVLIFDTLAQIAGSILAFAVVGGIALFWIKSGQEDMERY